MQENVSNRKENMQKHLKFLLYFFAREKKTIINFKTKFIKNNEHEEYL